MSKEIIKEALDMGYFLPIIEYQEHRSGWTIGIRRLPTLYTKWVAHVVANQKFRDLVKEKIQNVLSRNVFVLQSFLTMYWSSNGLALKTDGNACSIIPSDNGYYEHNVDYYEQSSILFIALTIYLREAYVASRMFEEGRISPEKFPPLKERITQRISLNKAKKCSLTLEECIHKLSWMCEICIRSSKPLNRLSSGELKRLGDKFEPEGGIEGKELCVICGANIPSDSEECSFCKEE